MRKTCRTISLNVDVDLEMDEIDTQDLKDELERRKEEINDEDFVPSFKTTDELLKYLNKVVGLKIWHSKERLIKEINDL